MRSSTRPPRPNAAQRAYDFAKWAILNAVYPVGAVVTVSELSAEIGLSRSPVREALLRLEAMMSSMTAKERAKPDLINAKRKIRIAKGSGTTVQEVNKLMKMHQEMANAMKRLKKLGGFGKLAAMFSGGGMEKALGGMAPGGQLPGGLPGLGGGPGFGLPPGFDKFSKK